MPTKSIDKVLRGLAEQLGAGEALKLSKGMATLVQLGRMKHMGFAAVSAHLGQAPSREDGKLPLKELAGKLGDGQILRIRREFTALTLWGMVQATGFTDIAKQLNQHSITQKKEA